MEDRGKFSIFNFQYSVARLLYYFRIWLIMSKNSFMIYLTQKLIFFIFFIGKIFRFIFYMAFIYFLIKGANQLLGYNSDQTIFFFLTFVLIDSVSQFFFREVYRFRSQVVTGDFDLTLVKPFSPLFRSLMGGADIIDLATIPIFIAALVYFGQKLNPSTGEVLGYIIMVLNGLVLAAAFHIAVLAFGIITLEIDHTVMIYRDITAFGRFPVDIYKQPLKTALIYLIPIGIMFTFPAKLFMGLLNIRWLFISVTIGILALLLSLRFWNIALKKYTSASS